jgi:hypothetical protein
MHETSQLMTLVLDTQPWSIEYAQYDSLFQFYPLGLKEVIYRAYADQAKSRNDSAYIHTQDQLKFANAIEYDFHDALAYQLEFHNPGAREIIATTGLKEALAIDQISAEILARIHRHWRHLFPHHRAVFHPTTLRWFDDAFSIEAAVEKIAHVE